MKANNTVKRAVKKYFNVFEDKIYYKNIPIGYIDGEKIIIISGQNVKEMFVTLSPNNEKIGVCIIRDFDKTISRLSTNFGYVNKYHAYKCTIENYISGEYLNQKII